MARVDGSMSVLVVRALLFGATSRGIRANELAERAGVPEEVLSPATLADPDGRVRAAHVLKLWEYLPGALNDPAFGLNLAVLAAGAPLSVAWWVVWSSPTLREGLVQGLRYQRLLHDRAHSELLWNGREGVYRHQIGDPPFRAPRHAIEFGFATFARFARRATGKDIAPSRVRFQHPAPRDSSQHRAVFGSQIEFDADQDELVYDVETLALPLLTADASLREIVESHARQQLARYPEESGLGARLQRAIGEALPSGRLTLERVAAQLGVAPRTLQRRLKLEGKTFLDHVDERRRELSVRYLRDRRLTIHEAAFLLGFSDVSAFHRAFVRWTGVTPRRFREQVAGPPGAPGQGS